MKDGPKSVDRKNYSGFLQTADLGGQKLRYIPLPKYYIALLFLVNYKYFSKTESRNYRIEQRRRYGSADSKYYLATFDQDSVVTVDSDGRIRLWEVNQAQLAKSLDLWRSAVGGIV